MSFFVWHKSVVFKVQCPERKILLENEWVKIAILCPNIKYLWYLLKGLGWKSWDVKSMYDLTIHKII